MISFEGYGMTETTLATHFMNDVTSKKYASVGTLTPNTECKVRVERFRATIVQIFADYSSLIIISVSGDKTKKRSSNKKF